MRLFARAQATYNTCHHIILLPHVAHLATIIPRTHLGSRSPSNPPRLASHKNGTLISPYSIVTCHGGTNGAANELKTTRSPLADSGSLDEYDSFDVTNIIGKQFLHLQLSKILQDDRKIKDLAILVSQRGVVFFREQNLNISDQKILGQKLGELTGRPETSKLRRHALLNGKSLGIKLGENGEELPDVDFNHKHLFHLLPAI